MANKNSKDRRGTEYKYKRHEIFYKQDIQSDESVLRDHGFILHKKIDFGSFSTVRLAEKVIGKNRVKMAVKIINRVKSPRIVIDKFLPRELQVLPILHHPNIIQVYSIFHLQQKTFIFMELASNGDVTTYLQENGFLPEPVARKWFIQILDAVRYCHQKHNIAHRDLKCENILLDCCMNAKLADFGFARYCRNLDNQKGILSETYCGSSAYAAPEIISGQPYNPKLADIWSLGVCLYTMVNNAMPFNNINAKVILKDQLHCRWKFQNINLSLELRNLIQEILNPDIIKRPSLRKILTHPWIFAQNHP